MATKIPADLMFTDHDEWARREDANIVSIGITDHAQDALGEIVHVEMPEVGDTFAAGSPVCEVESVKAVAEIYAPVAGEIVAINEDLDDGPEAINEDPYGAWLYKLKMSEPDDLKSLLASDAYKKKLEDGD